MGGVKATHVLDPVFMCEKQHYLDCIKNSALNQNPPKNKFLVAYILDPTDKKQEALEYVAKEKGLKLICLAMAHCKQEMIDNWRLPYLENIDVEDWLYYFKNADMVVTDSFHGMCFSIIFEKPFVAIVNKRRGADRFTDLSNGLGLDDRLVSNPQEIIDNAKILNDSIDYKIVSQSLEQRREKCLQWLSEALAISVRSKVEKELEKYDERLSEIDITNENDTFKTKIEEQDELIKRMMTLVETLNAENEEQYRRIIELGKTEEKQQITDRKLSEIENCLKETISVYESHLATLEKQNQLKEEVLIEEREKYNELEKLHQQIISSKSWKITEPMRKIVYSLSNLKAVESDDKKMEEKENVIREKEGEQ